MTRVLVVACLLIHATASAAPGLTLPAGTVSATLTLENDASTGSFGETASVAPDLAVGLSEQVTLQLVHSTFARTGLRGSAGAGVCATEACDRRYDNAGLELLVSLRTGALAIAATAGAHAWSIERDHYVAKVGARFRYARGPFTLASLPSVTVTVSERAAMMTADRDRLWLPLSAMATVGGGVSFGIGTGAKAPLDDLGSYELAAGVVAGYTPSPSFGVGASWVHGNVRDVESRALHVWISATR